MLNPAEIQRFIDDDEVSERKRYAKVGESYYEGRHDIEDYRIFYVNGNGDLEEDANASNIRISHPFFTELVDQETQYMLSGERFVRSDDDDLQGYLDEYFDDDFRAELTECLTCTVSDGFGYMYVYRGADGRLRFQNADAMGVVEIRAKDTDANADHIIYWYIDRVEKGQKTIKRIQVWDDAEVTYYVQVDDGKILPDADVAPNPRPHVLYEEDGATYYEGLGFIPFFRLDNNRKQHSALKPIKSLIDDYDLMSCALSNNLQDFTQALYVVKGFLGDDVSELVQNVKIKKHIGVSEDGDVEIRTVDIPYNARQVKLELDEKNIYRFGMGFNSAQVGDGNITNVVIKSRYALLDLKCNKLEIRLRQFLRKLIAIVLDDINDAHGTEYRQSDVDIRFDREIMTNALDNAQIEQIDATTQQIRVNTILAAAASLGDDALVEALCSALDLDYEDIADRIEPSPESEINGAVGLLVGSESQGEGVTANADESV